MTYHLLRQRLLQRLREFLDPIEAQQEVRQWFQEGLGLEGAWLAVHGGEPVPQAILDQVEGWMARRHRGEPWPMILGWVWFAGRRFQVRQGVLIPQRESEATVRVAMEVGQQLGIQRCVDVGTGAGNIGLTLALETDWHVTLTEIDPAALDLAQINGARFQAKADYGLGSLLEPVPDPLELVVANMPFVDEAMAPRLSRELAFEPPVAMLAGDQGIALSTALLAQAFERKARACVVEVGAGQGERLRPRALDQGWSRVTLLKDSCGQDRIFTAERD